MVVVSFKISRVGTRYRPKPKPEPEPEPELNEEEVDEPAQLPAEIRSSTARKRSADVIEDNCSVAADGSDAEASFILNIFPDGYSIVKPSKSNVGHQNAEQDGSQFLRPYDRRSESMITAIECAYLPADLLEVIDCKYINGTVQCEVRDYRKESSESAVIDSATADIPSVTKLSLKMSLDNVVKDIHLISDSTWEYGDLLEAEARILLALQPKLDLDPTPNLDRLCREPTYVNLNLDIRGKRLKRLRQESAPENSNSSVRDSREVTGQPSLVNLVDHNVGQRNAVATKYTNHAPENSYSGVSASRHVSGQPDFVNLIDENAGYCNFLATGPKNHARENSSASVRDSRYVTGQPDLVTLVEQNVGQRNVVATGPKYHALENSSLGVRDSRHVMSQPDLVNLVGQNVCHRNVVATGPKNHAPENSNLRVGNLRWITGQPDFVNLIDQNVSQSNMIPTGPQNCALDTAISSVFHQSGHQIINSSLVMSSVNDRRRNHFQVSPVVNLSKIGRSTHVALDGNQHMENTQRVPQQFEPNRSHQRVPQQFTRSNFHKAPWNNMTPNLESNTKGKEFSSGSRGLQLGAGAASVPVVGETRFFTFNPNESLQQAQMAANCRSNTLQTTPVISGLGSSSTVGKMISPSTAASYPVHTSMQGRFSIIKMLTARYKPNFKKNKTEEYKPAIFFSTQQLKHVLINDHDDDTSKDDDTCKMPLSMSLMGGNINICKTRVLIFVQNEHMMQENGFLEVPKFRLILSERESDGTVAMHLGELDDVDYLEDDQLLPTLPNTQMADLLAAQYCVLRLHEGYLLADDHLKPKPTSMVSSAGDQPNNTPGDFNAWLLDILERDPIESLYEVAELPVAESSHHNIHPQSIGLFPGGSSSRMHPHIVNNYRESELQNEFLKQQEQSRIQRTMMMRPDRMGHSIGGDNYSMVRFQGLGMGSDGRAGTRAVSPMKSQNPMATNQGLGQSNANIPCVQVRPCSNFGGLQGANRQIHLGSGLGSGSSGVSMLGSGTGINRANGMSAIQRNIIERLNQDRYKQQFQLIKQDSTSHLQAVLLSSQQAGSPSSSIGGQHQKAGPHQPTP